MSTVPIARAHEQIMKLDSDRQALPLLILEHLDPLFTANVYVGIYQWSNAGGAHYFIYDGKGKLNKQYRIEIEMYWDEINITINRSLTKWEKFIDLLKFIGGSIMCLLWIVVLVGAFTSHGDSSYTSASPGGDYESKRKKKTPPRSFNVKESAGDIAPGNELTNTMNGTTYEEVIKQHRAIFEQSLMPVIKGEQWMGWWNNTPRLL